MMGLMLDAGGTEIDELRLSLQRREYKNNEMSVLEACMPDCDFVL